MVQYKKCSTLSGSLLHNLHTTFLTSFPLSYQTEPPVMISKLIETFIKIILYTGVIQ